MFLIGEEGHRVDGSIVVVEGAVLRAVPQIVDLGVLIRRTPGQKELA